jgi:hypothetical protein
MFNHSEFDGHEQVTFVRDPASGLRAIVALYSPLTFLLCDAGSTQWRGDERACWTFCIGWSARSSDQTEGGPCGSRPP